MTNTLQALVTDIQRFSVHDGPGIRTTIFFKGCPLRCKWCQNPETNNPGVELMFTQAFCVGCLQCVKTCTHGAVSVKNGALVTDNARCNLCGACASVCPAKARKMIGTHYTLGRLMPRLVSDRVFFRNSNGGVTLSGGEPLAQPDFAAALLDALREEKIHSTLETCGYAPSNVFARLARRADLILFDVKHVDSDRHEQFTGVKNDLILRNLDFALPNVIVRFPLIPGANDDMETLHGVAELCLARGIGAIHILPFHQGGMSKWQGLNRWYEYARRKSLGAADTALAETVFRSAGLAVNVGGYI